MISPGEVEMLQVLFNQSEYLRGKFVGAGVGYRHIASSLSSVVSEILWVKYERPFVEADN